MARPVLGVRSTGDANASINVLVRGLQAVDLGQVEVTPVEMAIAVETDEGIAIVEFYK